MEGWRGTDISNAYWPEEPKTGLPPADNVMLLWQLQSKSIRETVIREKVTLRRQWRRLS